MKKMNGLWLLEENSRTVVPIRLHTHHNRSF